MSPWLPFIFGRPLYHKVSPIFIAQCIEAITSASVVTDLELFPVCLLNVIFLSLEKFAVLLQSNSTLEQYPFKSQHHIPQPQQDELAIKLKKNQSGGAACPK